MGAGSAKGGCARNWGELIPEAAPATPGSSGVLELPPPGPMGLPKTCGGGCGVGGGTARGVAAPGAADTSSHAGGVGVTGVPMASLERGCHWLVNGVNAWPLGSQWGQQGGSANSVGFNGISVSVDDQ